MKSYRNTKSAGCLFEKLFLTVALTTVTLAATAEQESMIRYNVQGCAVDVPRIAPDAAPDSKDQQKTPDTQKPKIDPRAKEVLDEVQTAYKNLKSIDLSGDFTVSVKTPGETRRMSQPFKSSYEQPNKFRHQMKPDVLVGCDGKSGYVFDEKENAYLRYNFPTSHQPAQSMPVGLLSTLLLQNPSLLFALTDSRVEDLLRSFGAVTRVDDAKIDGVQHPVLQFGTDKDSNKVRLFIDPDTHLVRRFVLDLKGAKENPGNPGTGDAAVSVDYTQIKPRDNFEAQHFAWAPPAGATDVLESAGAEPKLRPESSPQTQPNIGNKF